MSCLRFTSDSSVLSLPTVLVTHLWLSCPAVRYANNLLPILHPFHSLASDITFPAPGPLTTILLLIMNNKGISLYLPVTYSAHLLPPLLYLSPLRPPLLYLSPSLSTPTVSFLLSVYPYCISPLSVHPYYIFPPLRPPLLHHSLSVYPYSIFPPLCSPLLYLSPSLSTSTISFPLSVQP